jgi:hypothetical protein
MTAGPVRDGAHWWHWHVDVPARRRVSRELTELIGCGLAGPVEFTSSDYGLSRVELDDERRRLVEAGWRVGEVDRMLVDPDDVPDRGWSD